MRGCFNYDNRKLDWELEQRVRRLGANAVLGIEIDTGTINLDQSGVLLLITAVRV